MSAAGRMKQRPGDEQSRPAAAIATDVDHQFGRGRAGDEVAGAEVIEELFLAEPAASLDDLPLQHGDVGGGPSEGRRAELEEEPGDLPQ